MKYSEITVINFFFFPFFSFIHRAQTALVRRRVTAYVHGDSTQEQALALYRQSMSILGPNEGEQEESD